MSVEAFKSWSQNLGHEAVLTTLYSYGTVALSRQAEIIKSLGEPVDEAAGHELELARKIVRMMRDTGMPAP